MFKKSDNWVFISGRKNSVSVIFLLNEEVHVDEVNFRFPNIDHKRCEKFDFANLREIYLKNG